MFIVASIWAEVVWFSSSFSPGRKTNTTFARLSLTDFPRDSIESKVTPHETATVSDGCLLVAGDSMDNSASSDKLAVLNDAPFCDILAVSPFPVSSEWAATAPASSITTTNTTFFQLFPPPADGEQQSTPQLGDDESQQDSACFTLSSFASISIFSGLLFFNI